MEQFIHKCILNSEKVILVGICLLTIGASVITLTDIVSAGEIHLSDLLTFFLFVEVLSMASSAFKHGKIIPTIPPLIAMTALCRLVVLHTKESDWTALLAEATAILVVAIATLIIAKGYKDSDKGN